MATGTIYQGGEANLHQDQLRTIEEFAEQIRTTPSTIRYKLQVDPNFPKGFKLGVRRLWKQSSIDAWIDALYEAQTGQAA